MNQELNCFIEYLEPQIIIKTNDLNNNLFRYLEENLKSKKYPNDSIRIFKNFDKSKYLVPKLSHYEYHLEQALFAIKAWAKQRHIYGHYGGYLNEDALFIMLLKVFQLYPYSSIIDLITRFFEIYSEWDWENPVTLKYFIGDFCEISHYDIDNFSNKANSPMKIINPVYNCNSTFYVDNSNLELIKIELSRAKNIINQITNNCQDWSLLFKEKIIR